MHLHLCKLTCRHAVILGLALICGPGALAQAEGGGITARAALGSEKPYLAENSIAMTKMMNAMMVKPSGDVDKDFVDMMVPHHQGAIDMAIAILRYGHNERIRRLAQEIIVTQQQEIAAMRLAVGEPLPASTASPTTPSTPSPPAAQGGTENCHGKNIR